MNENKNIFGVILAGGSGSRLWPLSREMYPKQLLNLVEENSFFQSTFLRLTDIIPAKNIMTVTNNLHLTDIKLQLEELDKNLEYLTIGEPVGRNTAPAIGLATLVIKNNLAEKNSDPVIFVTPSDHLIHDNDAFLNSMKEGIKLAEDGYIVTFGIKPSKPETGYGYIKTFETQKLNNCGHKVDEFKEKPDFETAKKYVEDGNYFWNSGVFMFKASVILEELELYTPDIMAGLNNIDLSANFISKEDYQVIPSISIDYAVMEKSDKIALIPVDCGWNDLGSWEAICDVMKKDEKNNFIKGNVITVDTEDSYIYSSSRLVSAIGIKNKIIVETDDSILICDKSKTQDVKNIFEKLKKENNQIYFKHNTVNESWGIYKILQKNSTMETREITVKPTHKLVFSDNNKTKKHFYIISGQAKLIRTDNEKMLNMFESIDICEKTDLCIKNTGKSELKMIEISNI